MHVPAVHVCAFQFDCAFNGKYAAVGKLSGDTFMAVFIKGSHYGVFGTKVMGFFPSRQR
jgi:hypothetical protein